MGAIFNKLNYYPGHVVNIYGFFGVFQLELWNWKRYTRTAIQEELNKAGDRYHLLGYSNLTCIRSILISNDVMLVPVRLD